MLSLPHLMRVARTAGLVLGILMRCGIATFGSQSSGSAPLVVDRGDGTLATYQAYPGDAVRLLFPKLEARLEVNPSLSQWKFSPNRLRDRIQAARITDTGGRFHVSAVVLGDQLFIFDRLLGRENSETMSRLLGGVGFAPHDEAEALDLTKLYLSLSYNQLADPETFVVSGTSIVANSEFGSMGETKAGEVVAETHTPRVLREGAAYSAELYTHDSLVSTARQVSRWKITLGAYRLEEEVSAHHDGFRQLYSRSATGGEEGAGRIRFSVAGMGEGFSDDGARTDLQWWDASDGPGLQRIHAYYQSHEKAEHSLKKHLHDAVAVVDARPWRFADGQAFGTQMILIEVNEGDGTLMAAEVSRDDTSVLAISCFSLSNLLEAVGWDSPEWK